MNQFKQILKGKLQDMVHQIQDDYSSTYLDEHLVFVILYCQKLSLLFPFYQFADHTYFDEKLIILRDIVQWFTIQGPLVQIGNDTLHLVIAFVIGFVHWIVFLLLIFSNQNISTFQTFIKNYFSYLQNVILIPSILLIDDFGDSNYSLAIIFFIPLFLNSLIWITIQRNFQVPILNPYHKRYHPLNGFSLLFELIVVLFYKQVSEEYQTYFLFAMFLIMFFDSFIIQPYKQRVNAKYVFISSLLIINGGLKLLTFANLDQGNFLYFTLLLAPFFSIIILFIYQRIMENILFNSPISLNKILVIIDTFYDYQNTIILYVLIQTLSKSKLTKKSNLTNIIQQVILEQFEQLIQSLPNNLRYSDERIYLFKGFYLLNTCNQSSLAYINLKRYTANSMNISFYFESISAILQEQIQRQNYFKHKATQLNEQIPENLELFDIRQSEILSEQCIPLVYQIMDAKIKFWSSLLQGYPTIENLAETVHSLSEQIWKLQKIIFTSLSIDPFRMANCLNTFNSIQLRLLSLIYSTVLNDYHGTLDIEQRLQEILSFERNITSESIKNTSLLNDELVLLSTSIIKNYGMIINRNRATLAKFFGYEDEKEFMNVVHIEQLMPKFISELHSSCLRNYLNIGYSEIFDVQREVFYILKTGFIQCCYLQLVHIYEKVNDYIITGSLQKIQTNSDFLAFDSQGRIVGMTESLFDILIEQSNAVININQILYGSFIYFWFPNIIEQIVAEKEDIEGLDAYQKQGIKQQIVYPINNILKVIAENSSFRKLNNWGYSQQDSRLISKQSHVSHVSQLESHEKKTEIYQNSQIDIELFKEAYKINVKSFLETSSLQDSLKLQGNPYMFKYLLQIRKLGPNQVPIFIMKITDMYKKTRRYGPLSYSTTQGITNQSVVRSDEIVEAEITQQDEPVLDLQFNHPVVNQLGAQLEELSSFNQNPPIEDQQHILSPRGDERKPIKDAFNQGDAADKDEEEEGEGEENESRQLDQIKSSSQAKVVKQDIKQILQMNKELQIEQNEQDVLKSKTSATSDRTQNSIFHILRQLQYSKKYQTTIVKALINTLLLFISILVLIIIQILLNRSNTEALQATIPLVRVPDRFNRLYCTFVTLGQMDMLQKLVGYQFSPYYQYRIPQTSVDRREEILQVIQQLKKSFSTYENSGQIDQLNIRVINQYTISIEEGTMIYFDTMVNENTQRLNYYFQATNLTQQSEFEEQVAVQFLKGNLRNQLTLSRDLIQQIVQQFFDMINEQEFIHLLLMIIQLMIVTIMIIIQFKFWREPYLYMQNILLLISRISEKDIEIMSLKYKQLKEKLQNDASKWRQLDYFKEIYNYRLSELKKFQRTLQQSTVTGGNDQRKNRVKAKQTSRIQETTFSILLLYLMLIFLWLLLCSYSISSFLYQYINMINSYPELNLCMNFVQFKSDFDSIMILSQLLKNQQVLLKYTMDNIQTGAFKYNSYLNNTDEGSYFNIIFEEMLTMFVSSRKAAYSAFSTLYSDIVSSNKISQTNKAMLLGLYQEDLCTYLEQTLPFCAYSDGVFKYFPEYPKPYQSDNNRLKFKYGLNGIVQEMDTIFNSYYVYELKGQKDPNYDQILAFLDSSEFWQLVLAYSFDINVAIVQFYVTIIETSINILESNKQAAELYYILYGVAAYSTLFIIIIIRAITLQTQIRSVRQALVVLPHESLLDQQTYNAIKRFERNM